MLYMVIVDVILNRKYMFQFYSSKNIYISYLNATFDIISLCQ